MRPPIGMLALLVASLVGAGTVRAQEATTSPHGADLKEACSACHRADAWTPVKISPAFKHAPKTFPLEGAHAQTICTSCHKRLDFQEAPTKCASCHEDTHHGELGSDCGRCHTPRSFIDPEPMRRAHDQTRFPLRGAHALASCEACHTPTQPGQMEFVGRPTTCFGCHAADYQSVKSPDHQASGFPQDCTACHTQVTWTTATFDHNATAFPLTGAHAAASCQDCHADKVYKGKSTDCYSCHKTNYDGTTDPPHAASGFPTTCASCHNTTDWSGTPFDHNTTAFTLTGAHLAATCADCHGDGVYKGKATDCYSCHRTDFDNTANPPHAASSFPNTCETCHTTTAWTGTSFDHSTTQFPLTGAHLAATCVDCHGDGVYQGKSTDCFSCHKASYDATTDPQHAAAGFATTCTTCHSTANWTSATYDHATTGWPLTGQHIGAACVACHGNNVYAGTSTDCYACHKTDYDNATNPNHVASSFPNTCTTCHTTAGWTGTSFDHTSTGFPLTGAHLAATCTDCHGDGVYAGKSTDCYSCHKASYDGTTDPQHAAAGFATTCATCHSTTNWTSATYDHATTGWPLTGAHIGAACVACHGNNVYAGTSTDCYACHQSNYSATTNPPHAASGFPNTCETCHTTSDWTSAVFDHNATAFPLTGAHLAASCLDCHGDGVYQGKSTDCYACHASSYNATTTPPHAASSIGTACANCHNTTQWPGATYDHSVTAFPLTGAHLATTCAQCHGDGVWKGKSTDCYSCHQADYNGTTNPNHAAALFPTTCASCHNTTQWAGATFDHDTRYFPIYSGHHAGTWSSCATCHTSPSNFSVFTCLVCHEHDQSSMDSHHVGISGYSYDSQKCYACHPRGRAD